jgi:hypothetical protein
MRIKNTMNYDQNDCTTVFFNNPIFFDTCNTLKTKVGHVVGCIFEVGGFLILKQIICTVNRLFSTISKKRSPLITARPTPPKILLEYYLQFYLSIPVINCFDKRYLKSFNSRFLNLNLTLLCI